MLLVKQSAPKSGSYRRQPEATAQISFFIFYLHSYCKRMYIMKQPESSAGMSSTWNRLRISRDTKQKTFTPGNQINLKAPDIVIESTKLFKSCSSAVQSNSLTKMLNWHDKSSYFSKNLQFRQRRKNTPHEIYCKQWRNGTTF